MMDQADQGHASMNYDFSIVGAPDAISAPLVAGNLDIGLIPVNLAAVLFNQTHGGIKLAAVNTLGVLYVVSGDSTVTQLSDLAGKTVVSTGKGTTPQFVFEKVLADAGLTDSVTVSYRAQATEVASVLAATPSTIAVLPEPYVTIALAANPDVHIVADLNDAWQQAVGSPLVTGCVAVRTAFAENEIGVLNSFLNEYQSSIFIANHEPAYMAPLIVAKNLAPNDDVAKNSIARSHIVFMTGDDAKKAVGAYLKALFTANPNAVGGALPDDSFYYNNFNV